MQTIITTLTVILFTGLLYQPHNEMEKSGKTEQFVNCPQNLKNGDIVLRNGKGFISDMFRKTSQHRKEYSHAGIVRITPEGIMVVHVLANNQKTGLIIEPISQFCNSTTNKSYGVYRYSFLEGKDEMIKNFIDEKIREEIVFDEHFDLQSDTALYCTEFIYKMCRDVAGFNLPVTVSSGENYIAMDNLYNISEAQKIYSHNY